MPSVYIETSIPSFYHTSRRSALAVAWREQTRLWWDQHRPAYELFTSSIVLDELRASPSGHAQLRLELLDGIPLLEPDASVERVVQFYLTHRLMPRNSVADAFHTALASHYAIDFILTWNCRHIANANKTPHLRVLNARLGLPVPVMATPYNLVPENQA